MSKKEFEIMRGINLLWVADEEKIDKLFANKEGLSQMIKNINKLYGTKIKKIIHMHHNIEKLGYNIFYEE